MLHMLCMHQPCNNAGGLLAGSGNSMFHQPFLPPCYGKRLYRLAYATSSASVSKTPWPASADFSDKHRLIVQILFLFPVNEAFLVYICGTTFLDPTLCISLSCNTQAFVYSLVLKVHIFRRFPIWYGSISLIPDMQYVGTYSPLHRKVKPKQNWRPIVCLVKCPYYIDDSIVYFHLLTNQTWEIISCGDCHLVIHNSAALVTHAYNACNLQLTFRLSRKLQCFKWLSLVLSYRSGRLFYA